MAKEDGLWEPGLCRMDGEKLVRILISTHGTSVYDMVVDQLKGGETRLVNTYRCPKCGLVYALRPGQVEIA